MIVGKVHNGRFTANIEGDFVVFVIGARVNKIWKFNKWIPVAKAMGPMLKELYEHPESGFLGATTSVGGRTVTVVQYWRSVEDLQRFAKDQDDLHFPAWRSFNARVGASGDVGVYHETYKVAARQYEAIYANMPIMGLAAAVGVDHVKITRRSESAADRLAASPAEPESIPS